jgi:hypothetical protein
MLGALLLDLWPESRSFGPLPVEGFCMVLGSDVLVLPDIFFIAGDGRRKCAAQLLIKRGGSIVSTADHQNWA